jgi:hypothetical protein
MSIIGQTQHRSNSPTPPFLRCSGILKNSENSRDIRNGTWRLGSLGDFRYHEFEPKLWIAPR